MDTKGFGASSFKSQLHVAVFTQSSNELLDRESYMRQR